MSASGWSMVSADEVHDAWDLGVLVYYGPLPTIWYTSRAGRYVAYVAISDIPLLQMMRAIEEDPP